MKKSIIYTFLLTVSFLSTLLLPLMAQPSHELTVSAAASLKGALEEIKPIYEQQNPQTKLVYNFGASGSLQQQIEQGATVDIFFSAAAKQMDALASGNLIIPETRRDLLANDLVLITPVDITKVSGFEDLTKSEVEKIAMGDPASVPVGQYAEETLTYYGILEQIRDKLVYGTSVTQVLTYVDSGNVDAGIVFTTDAKTSPRVKVIATATPESHAPIVYPIAVIKDSQQPEIAKNFIDFLAGDEAQTVFTKFGFKVK